MSAPDPADYGHLPGDGDYLRGIAERPELATVPAEQRYDMAKRMGLHRKHTGDTTRPLVNLPGEDVQLGSRWRHVLTGEQLMQAQARGMLQHLMSGHDPDAGTPANT